MPTRSLEEQFGVQLVVPPGWRRERATLVLLDVVGYSSQLSQLGGAAGAVFQESFADHLRHRAAACGLTLIKQIGDASLLWTDRQEAVVDLALTLFLDNPVPAQEGSIRPRLRMLAHEGWFHRRVDAEGNWIDVAGPTAVVLFRLEKSADENHVLVTPDLHDALEERLDRDGRFRMIERDQAPLKGVERQTPRFVWLLRPPLRASVRFQELPPRFQDRISSLWGDVQHIPVFGNLAEPIPMAEHFLDLRLDPAHATELGGYFQHSRRGKDRFGVRDEETGDGEESSVDPSDAPNRIRDEGLRFDGRGRLNSHVSASDLFQVMPWAVIEGLPGAGKTTILRYFAYRALKADPHQVVLFVPLRRVTRAHIALLDQEHGLLRMLCALFLFPDRCPALDNEADWAALDASTVMLEKAWREEQAILLLDALDEVPRAEDRKRIAGAFVNLREKWPKPSRLTDSLRTFGAYLTTRTGELLAGAGAALQAAPLFGVNALDQSQLHRLVDRRLVAGSPVAEKCKDALVARPDIRRVAGTPMTALLMIFFYEFYGNWALRFETYRILVLFVLFRVWTRAKTERAYELKTFFQDVRRPDFLPSHPELKLQIDCLARQSRMMLSEPNPAHTGEAETSLGRALSERGVRDGLLRRLKRSGPAANSEQAEHTVQQWLDFWREEGVLLPDGPGRVSFVHSTVMEFLAAYDAAALLDFEPQNDPEFLRLLQRQASAEGESLEVLPILCSRSWQTGHEVLRRLEAEVEAEGDPPPVPILGLRCLVETELAEWEKLSALESGYDYREILTEIEEGSGAGWLYGRIAAWFRLPHERRPDALAEAKRWAQAPGLPQCKALEAVDTGWVRARPPARADVLIEALLHERELTRLRTVWSGVELTRVERKTLAEGESAEQTEFLELLARFQGPPLRDRVRRELAWIRESPRLAVRDARGDRNSERDLDLALIRGQSLEGGLTGPVDLLGSPRMRHGSIVRAVAFSPDGKIFATGHDLGCVRLWDAGSGTHLNSLFGHKERVTACAFSPDGSRIVSASSDNSLIIWDATSGSQLRALSGHMGSATACAYSPDGNRILSASSDKSLILWDATSGSQLRSLPGHEAPVTACAFSPDGAVILSASGDSSLILWDAASGSQLRTLTGHRAPVTACAFSPDGSRILSGSSDKSLILWDAVSGSQLHTLSNHEAPVTACSFSPDGSRILSASGDNSLVLWDAASGLLLRLFSEHTDWVTACAFSPDGSRILSASRDNSLILWDTESGSQLRSLFGHKSHVYDCVFSPDGSRILTASGDNSLILWDSASGTQLHALSGHTDWVRACAFSPDDSCILSASDDNSLILWDAESGSQLCSLSGHTDRVRACTFSPSGARILSASRDNSLILWDALSGSQLRSLSGHRGYVTACAFSPDSTRILSASEDSSLILWDAGSGAVLGSVNLGDSVVSLAVHPTLKLAAAGLSSGLIVVVDYTEGGDLAATELPHQNTRSLATRRLP